MAAVTAVTERCRCAVAAARFNDAEQVRSDELLARDAVPTTCLKAQGPLWAHLGQSQWCSLDSWSASSTVTFTRGPLSVCASGGPVNECVERRLRVRQPRASSTKCFPDLGTTYTWHAGSLTHTCARTASGAAARHALPGPYQPHAHATRRRLSASPHAPMAAGDDACSRSVARGRLLHLPAPAGDQ